MSFIGGGGGGGSAWGSITGTLSSQTDLNTALGAKAPTASPTFTGTATLPSGIADTSAGLNIGTYSNDGHTLTIGTTRLSTAGNTAYQTATLPSGGRWQAIENGQQVVTMAAESANWGAFAAGRDWVMQWQMGKGTSHYGFGKVRGYGSNSAVGNAADATEDDLISKTVQANALIANGQTLTIRSWGTTGATGNTKTIKLYFGGSVIGTISTTANAKYWRFYAEVSYTGASSQKYCTEKLIDGTVTTESGTLAINNAATAVIKTTGQSSGSAASDVLNEVLWTDYDRQGN